MSDTLDSFDGVGTVSTTSLLASSTAIPLSSDKTVSRYPTHVVLILAVLAGLLILLAFNAAIWYWCLTHRYIRRSSLQQSDMERATATAVGRPETAMSWGNTTRSISKMSWHETESAASTLRADTPLQNFMQWRWPTAIMKEDGSAGAAAVESEKAIPPHQTVPAIRTPPRPTIVTEVASRSASPATVRGPRSFSPAPSSRAGTPSSARALDVDISAAYAMPYDSCYSLPLPSPPIPGGLTPPPPPRLTVRTAVETKERGRRSPLSS